MSDSVPSRTDAVVPDPQAADITQSSASIARTPGSDLGSAETIERMAERLRFYESFDELIQLNIARSGQLMREAGEKRDEAIATIARSRQQVETERETQRSALTELLDDVMTIQQATERLAHRVSDALEQIEFELEPIGLHEIGSLGGQQDGRLPAGFASGTNPFQSVAEAVDDEYRLGVLGQPRPGGATMSSTSVPHGVESSSAAPANSGTESTSDVPATPDHVAESPNEGVANPENVELTADAPVPQDATESRASTVDVNDAHEQAPGAGAEAAPVETSAATWDQAHDPNGSASDGDLLSVVEPYAEADVEPYAEDVEPDGAGETPVGQVASDLSDEIGDEPTDTELHPTDPNGAADDTTVGAGSTTSFDTEPLTANATSPDVLSTEEIGGASADGTGVKSDSGIDAEVDAVAAQPVATVAANGTGVPGDPVPVMAPSSSSGAAAEHQTTVVLDGVPRAAIALAIQRHILSKPDVLRAEVREYYDHRLTLFVTGRRATTADDLEDWDGSAAWEQIRTSPELLELRMVT